MKEEELAFLKAHLAELPATALRQLRRDILQERRRRKAEATAKAKGSGDRPTVPKEEAPANGPPEPPRGGASPKVRELRLSPDEPTHAWWRHRDPCPQGH
jgi:hypothetical protein